ncbi:MAG: FkbM family methyltransferase [Pseudomonadota bacterium]
MATGMLERLHGLGRVKAVRALVGGLNALVAPLGPWPVKVDGLTIMAGSLDRLAVLWLMRAKRGDRLALELWDGLCRPGAVVLDVGANLGLYALRAARRVGPDGRVIAFEADPDNARLLNLSVARNRLDNVTIRAEAVAAAKGAVRLFIRPEHKGDSELSYPGGDRPSIEVPAVTIDAALAGDLRVDLMKLDIQGAEAFAIRGMEAMLAASPGLKVISEFWPEGLARCGMKPLDYLRWWHERGFAISRIDEEEGRLEPVEDLAALTEQAHAHQDANLFLERRP